MTGFLWALLELAPRGLGLRVDVRADGWVVISITQSPRGEATQLVEPVVEGRAMMHSGSAYSLDASMNVAARQVLRRASELGLLGRIASERNAPANLAPHSQSDAESAQSDAESK